MDVKFHVRHNFHPAGDEDMERAAGTALLLVGSPDEQDIGRNEEV